MNRILHIFRKDARRLWPQASVFCALLAANAGVERWYPRTAPNQKTILMLLTLLLPVACSVLLIALIHEERLVGDRPYWLSRPIPRRELFAAKVIFILVFVNLPVFLYQAYMVVTGGLPFFSNGTNFLWLQLFFTAIDILPMVALASVTKNMVQAVLAALALAVGMGLSWWLWFLAVSDVQVGVFGVGHSSLTWIEVTLAAGVLILGCVPILLRQYNRRGAFLSRILLAATVPIAASSFLMPHSAEWALQMKTSPMRIAPNDFQVSWAYGQRVYRRPAGGDVVSLGIPIHIERPAGLEVALESGTVSMFAPSGARFESYGAEGDRGGGFNSLIVALDPMSYQRIKDTPVHVYGVLNLTVLSNGPGIPFPVGRLTPVPGIGACLAGGGVWIACNSVLPRARLQVIGDEDYMADSAAVLAPYPHSIGYSPIVPVIPAFGTPEQFGGRFRHVQLRIQKPVAYIQRTFDFGNVILSDYESDRP